MTDHIPRVSVGMPVYNSERWIVEAVDSILRQSYRDLELIICDNASTDGTPEICRAIVARDRRVRYCLHPENLGINENYNQVFRRARGMYFKWASSNDICDERLIERCVEVLEARPDVVLCHAHAALFSDRLDTGEEYGDDLDLQDSGADVRLDKFFREVRLNNVMNGVIRAAALRNTAPIRNFYCSDLVMVAELVLRGKFVQLPDRMFYRRMSSETSTKFGTPERLRGHYRYYNTERGARMLLQHWKLVFGYLGAVVRAPLKGGERVRVYRRFLKQVIWIRHKLAMELYEAARSIFERAPRAV